ncbi:Endophilin-B2 [Merluccius polli]|uniref:Endophilin-B2 n=1 Tax=Merluccius polli TaxID=89951 RepID=A0AA47LZ31_MERPO|nr:Endophilin-B2 [Merluccius polli]
MLFGPDCKTPLHMCIEKHHCCEGKLITVYTVPGMDSDWLVGERANDRGRVPVTYLELLS